MSSRAVCALVLVGSAACHHPATPPRERVLARIPAGAQVIIAADGPALSAPRMRAVVDVLRPRWPSRFGCVIDAALAGDHVAVGITASRDMTVVVATRAQVTCPGLSKIDEGLWTATLGAGKPAAAGSVLDDGPHARARPYLLSSPIALSIALPGLSVLATASSDPLEAWVAIDTLEIAVTLVEQKVRGVVNHLAHADATAPFAKAIEISHTGAQVVARLTGPVDADLAIAVRTTIDWYSVPAVRAAVGFSCPDRDPTGVITGCTNGTSFTVASLANALAPLESAEVAVIIDNGRVEWLRLDKPIPSLGLRRGDLLLAAEGRHLGSANQLVEMLRGARRSISLTIQRDAVTATLELVER